MRLSAREVETEIAGLDACDRPALLLRWRSLTGRLPGPGLRGELLRSAIAYRLQEQSFGGLSPAVLRRMAIIAKAHGQEMAGKTAAGGGSSGSPTPSRSIKPGSRLIREWRGAVHEVVVDADGYLWNGGRHASLSTIARAITGTNWNGWRFFGINKARGKVRGSAVKAAATAASMRIPDVTVSGIAANAKREPVHAQG